VPDWVSFPGLDGDEVNQARREAGRNATVKTRVAVDDDPPRAGEVDPLPVQPNGEVIHAAGFDRAAIVAPV